VASSVFRKPLGEVIRSVVPYMVIMLVGLGIVTYVPTLAVGPVNVLLRDEPFYEPLPQVGEDGRPIRPGREGGPAVEVKKVGEVNEQGERVLSPDEMTAIGAGITAMCDAAETVMDAELPPGERVARWRKELDKEEVTYPDVLAVVAIVEAGGPQAYAKVEVEATKLMKTEWTCEALEELLKAEGGEAKADAKHGE
jgi:hypothetical protein